MAPSEASATAKLAGYLSHLSPIPAFPEYTGPYKVGTVDVEVPVADLPSPSPAPDNTKDIPTVLFRVFYPAVAQSNQKRITWLPSPPRSYVSAYAKLMGVGHTLAELLSFFPRHLYYTSIPAHENATMQQAETENKRWPTMIFSHGLGGSRNTYSYIAGSLASHGVVVVCPEHRDGSAVVSYIRVPNQQGHSARTIIPHNLLSHDVTPRVYQAREAQLRIRLWELGLVHEAVLAMDAGRKMTNLCSSRPSLDQFINQLSVNEPSSIVFSGHSFGATTVYQLLKTTFYAEVPEIAGIQQPLFRPAEDSNIRKQVTEKSVTMLLDMWCLPLMAPNSAPLLKLPLPAYADVPSASGGTALLAVQSQAFYKWHEHLETTARLLSPDPSAKAVTASMFERPSGNRLPEPNFFYAVDSSHLSQSDFGILFPWLLKRLLDAVEPERVLRLNLRAQLQLLRTNNISVARTYMGDLVDGVHIDKLDATGQMAGSDTAKDGLNDDKAILDRSKCNIVDHWRWIDIIGLGKEVEENNKTAREQIEEGQQKLKLGPSEQTPLPATLEGVVQP